MKFLLFTAAYAVNLSANPIRRVVNMLQAMQKKCEEEGRKEADLYEKFQCYCKSNKGVLVQSIADAETKIAQLETQVSEDTAAKAQLDEELKNHKTDRAEAQQALAGATKIRQKDAATFAKNEADLSTNIKALGKAIGALEQGLSGGAFMQTMALEGATLKKLVTTINLSDIDRESVTAFLSNSATAPGTSEIVGILKEMKDEMERDHKDLVAAENTAIAQFEALKAAKNKEIAAATRAIEKKTQRSGELAVKIVEGKNDLEDTRESLSEDEQFQLNLKKDCAQKEKDQNERVKTRAEEIQAISETIKILNDDDALDLFNKTLPKPRAAALIQIKSKANVQARARELLKTASKQYKSVQLDLISLALNGKKVDFSKVLKMIDDMVGVLGQEQKDDDEHRDYCTKEFDVSDDKKKALERRIEDLTHDIEEATSSSNTLSKEIKALQAGIKALDKSVAEATEQRKAEHAEFVETSTNNQAAVDLIAFAKNRLNKFYNPKLYKPPPPRQLTEEERIAQNFGEEIPTEAPTGIAGTDIGTATFIQLRNAGAPPPPPETFGAYSKKSSESGGVIAMIDMLSNDIKKEMAIAETEEKNSQADYEELMTDSQKKRAADSKSITTKEQAKAEADSVAESTTENLNSSNQELLAAKEYIANLHKSCDFLMENYDVRKTARSAEIDALKKAKAVLKGADYSFLQESKGPDCDCIGQKGPDCDCIDRTSSFLAKRKQTEQETIQ